MNPSIVFANPWLRVGIWRAWWPCSELRRRGFHSYVIGQGGEAEGHQLRPGDVLILHVTNQDTGLRKTARHFRSLGVRVILQFDDDYSALPFSKGGIQKGGDWWDTLMDDQLHAVRECSLVIASTPYLAGKLARYAGGEVRVIRNWLPRWVTEVRIGQRFHPPMCGWFGQLGAHRQDIEWLGHEAQRIIRFGVMGEWKGVEEITGRTLDWREDTLMPWDNPRGKEGGGAAERFYHTIRGFSVGIAPLAPHEFNRSKSWIKPLEFGALGIPCVMADWEPYRDLAADGYTGAEIAATPERMVDAANWWLEHPQMSKGLTPYRVGSHQKEGALTGTIREEVRERYTLEARGGDEWEDLAAEVLPVRAVLT